MYMPRILVVGLLGTTMALAAAADSQPSESVDLALRQGQIADRYRQLENLMLKMAEYDASNNPRRAALLRQAIAKGKQQQIVVQLDSLVKLLQGEQLQKAVDGQGSVHNDLKVLLDLLLSEDRPDRLKNEQARVRDYIKQLDRIIRLQKSVQGRTESGAEEGKLSKDQQRVAERTGELGDKIDEAEGLDQPGGEANQAGPRNPGNPEGKQQPGESREPSDGDQSNEERNSNNEKDPDNGEPADSKSEGSTEPKNDDTAKPGDGQSSDAAQEQSGTPNDAPSQPSGDQGDSNPSPPSQGSSNPDDSNTEQRPSEEPSFPGRRRIAAAEDRMRQAQEDLETAQRDSALDKQEEARRLLEQAKAELEEILRQLREEEIERVLALLEGRFRRMLEMELKVQDGTVRLSKTPAAKRTRQFTIRVGKLSLDQRRIVLEVDKALTLLREEGSSVAFPEAVEQIRADMEDVAELLAEENVGSLTQGIEADIVTALEEIIAALQQAQQEAEERKNQPQPPPGQPSSPGDQPLVNKIAELKMIRALQMRVNTRTQRFSKMLADVEDPVGQATDDKLIDRIKELSTRQQRIFKVTSDIVLGKNK